MKLILAALLSLWLLPAISPSESLKITVDQGYTPVNLDSFPPFDEWGDINFSDERARLDNAAIYWQKHPTNIIYLVVFAGETACIGEATARGVRAKRHLLKRHVPSDHVVWIDGGWIRDVTTTVWIWPPEAGRPPVPSSEYTLKPSEVKLEKGCKIKNRSGRD